MTEGQWKSIRHFHYWEFVSPDTGQEDMDYRLVKYLDIMRETLDISIIITSGFRSPEHNKFVGGKPDSAHLYGKASDIECKDSRTRYLILNYLMHWNGFVHITRIGIGKNFIHIDIDETKPQNVVWTYYDEH